jgi:hypothetical protein
VPSPALYMRKVQENALKAAEVRVNDSVDPKSKRKKIRSKSGGDRTPRLVVYLCTVVGRKAQQKCRVHHFTGAKCERMRSKLQR